MSGLSNLLYLISYLIQRLAPLFSSHPRLFNPSYSFHTSKLQGKSLKIFLKPHCLVILMLTAMYDMSLTPTNSRGVNSNLTEGRSDLRPCILLSCSFNSSISFSSWMNCMSFILLLLDYKSELRVSRQYPELRRTGYTAIFGKSNEPSAFNGSNVDIKRNTRRNIQ